MSLFAKYFVTSLVIGFTAICIGWIINPDSAATLWNHYLPIVSDALDPYIHIKVADKPHTFKPIKETSNNEDAHRLFTLDELKQYDGTDGSKGLYLAFFGRVYDVGKGVEHYGPGGGYRFFAACDASRAFVTGDFTEDGLTDDLDGLSPREMLEVKRWTEFYETDYTPVGTLIGRFYDANGKPTDAKLKVEDVIKEGLKEEDAEQEDKKKFPPCNSEWKQGGGRVWCSTLSGGISRSWEGLPRKYYKQGAAGWRCACVREEDLDKGMFRLFDDCEPTSDTCTLTK